MGQLLVVTNGYERLPFSLNVNIEGASGNVSDALIKKEKQSVNDNSTPTQRRQKRIKNKELASTFSRESEPSSNIAEDNVSHDGMWDTWEAEARQMTQTQEEWQIYMDRKALKVTQKTRPETIHARYAGKPSPMTPEIYKRLMEAAKGSRSRKKPI